MMDWGLVQTIITIVSVTVAIVFGVIALRGIKRKKPVWAYNTRHIIGLEAEAPPELKLLFGSKEVSDVYKTTLVLLNKGNDIIDRSDVAEKITIHFGDTEILREPVVKANKDTIGFSAIQVVNNEVNAIQLDFKWLGRHDGATIEVWHSKDADVTCSGEIKNVKLTQVKQTIMTRPEAFRGNIFMSFFGLAFLGVLWQIVVKDIVTPGVDWEMVAMAIFFTALLGYFVGGVFYRAVRYITYPSWARFKE